MYITAQEYADITGRAISEAGDDILRFASLLLDSRLGNTHLHEDLTGIDDDEKTIVKRWVAYMAANIVDEDADSDKQEQSVSLGSFSVTYDDDEDVSISAGMMPEDMRLVDLALVSTGLVNKRIRVV